MTKLRVYEYAKQLNMSSKEIITILGRLDVPVANHMSVMDEGMVQKVEQFFSDVKQRAAQRHATEVERELREKQRQRERAARQLEQQRNAELTRPENRYGTGAGAPADGRSDGARSSFPAQSRTDLGTIGRSSNRSASDRLDRAGAGNRPTTPERKPAALTREHPGTESTEPSTSGASVSDRDAVIESTPRANEQRPQSDTREAADVTARSTRSAEADDATSRRERDGNQDGARRGGERGQYDNRNAYGTGQGDRGTVGSQPRDGQGRGNYSDRRPSGGYSGPRDNRAPSTGTGSDHRNAGSAGSRDNRGAGGYNGNRDNRTGGIGGNRDNRPGSGGFGGNRDNRQPGSGGFGGNRDNRPGGGGFGGNRDNRTGGGGFGGNRDNRTGGGFGGGRPGGSRPGGGFGGNRDGGRPGGGFSGSRDGGRPGGGTGGGRPGGGRPNGGLMVASAKPASPMARKDKEKDKPRDGFDRDRKERFNEDKLVQRGGPRKRPSSGPSTVARKPELPTKVTVEGAMSVSDFAKLLKREPSELIKKLLFLGIMATINQEIDTDAMELIAGEFGVELTVLEPVDEEALDMLIVEDKQEDLAARPPVVTIMGHVDHGKTTLLDAFRESKVTSTESGGITQHIGAYQVEINDRKITFLDTPGHEAFTTMRARGAQVTDITILVVAADDGVMPQTIEAINHAKAANVPIIVAVNKMDKPGANPDRIKQELTVHGLVSEEWGGDTVFVNVSALKRENLDALLEMVLLVADVADLKANPTGRPRGTVIEAKLDKGRGPVATVLVQNGTLRVGDIVVAGMAHGRVRAMVNDLGKRLKEAGPSTPVEIQGLGEVPSAGDLFVVYDDERAARNLVQKRSNRERAEQMQTTSRVTLDDLYKQIKEGNVKDLNVIVKADVQGSVEALVQSIEKIDVEGVRVKVIHRGAGAITESDVSLASASNAIIIGFHVRPDVNASRAADAEKVDIRLYRVIYNVTEELESAMRGMLEPTYKEVVVGHAEVRQVFKISKIGTVAGCYVTDGKVTRDAETRVIRDGVVVYEGSLDTLKRFKDDAREVATGFECGITLERFNDIKVGDVIEAFKMEAENAH